jgi:hypothetical protein
MVGVVIGWVDGGMEDSHALIVWRLCASVNRQRRGHARQEENDEENSFVHDLTSRSSYIKNMVI